jgi:uncharacterized surface protein with fasciclin (FAS1) repeats
MSNITQVVRTDKNMTTLKQGVIASGVDQVLEAIGPYTLLAPLDTAFRKLNGNTLADLLKPKSKVQLTRLLQQHVVVGKVNFKDLKDGEKLTTLLGKHLSVKVQDGKVSIDNATIQTQDIHASNGVIHSLDTVLAN